MEFPEDARLPERHPLNWKRKTAAGAVLITTIGAAVIGLLVFCSVYY
ncbi:hypothetical protein EGM51_03170 [Verrucomicrobia bacterium S94]|nr:hypothetical protein EGM51_03170 [Verrucomicrobia bacterium S94]